MYLYIYIYIYIYLFIDLYLYLYILDSLVQRQRVDLVSHLGHLGSVLLERALLLDDFDLVGFRHSSHLYVHGNGSGRLGLGLTRVLF